MMEAFLLLIVLATLRAITCLRREPDRVIGKPGSPYMRRWYYLPRNRLFNIYVHHILRSDDDRGLHDHPWINVSIVLWGGYREVMPCWQPTAHCPLPPTMSKRRGVGSIVWRRPRAAHRLEIAEDRSSWSLFITGPKVRTWGFWCPRGWKPWQQFVDPSDSGAIGPGCGEG